MGIIRKTKSLRALTEIFENHQEAFPATTLVERLSSEMNKTTVYRTLERMEDEGIIHSFKGKDGLQWYAKCHGCQPTQHSDLHPHFQCSDCGKTECLDIIISMPQVPNHKVEAAQVLLIGQCANCMV